MDTGYKLSLGKANHEGKLLFSQPMVNPWIYDAIVITEEPIGDTNPAPNVPWWSIPKNSIWTIVQFLFYFYFSKIYVRYIMCAGGGFCEISLIPIISKNLPSGSVRSVQHSPLLFIKFPKFNFHTNLRPFLSPKRWVNPRGPILDYLVKHFMRFLCKITTVNPFAVLN